MNFLGFRSDFVHLSEMRKAKLKSLQIKQLNLTTINLIALFTKQCLVKKASFQISTIGALLIETRLMAFVDQIGFISDRASRYKSTTIKIIKEKILATFKKSCKKIFWFTKLDF